jgi:hypothetical protein
MVISILIAPLAPERREWRIGDFPLAKSRTSKKADIRTSKIIQ